MNILINYATFVLDNSFTMDTIQNSPVLKQITEMICEFNKENTLRIMNSNTDYDYIRKLENIVKKAILHVNIKGYYVVFEDSILFNIRNNKISYNKDISPFISKDFLKNLMSDIISNYIMKGLVSRDTVSNCKFNEDFLMLNIVVFKKHEPLIYIQPGELNRRNKNNSWEFVENMFKYQESNGFDTDGTDDDNDDYSDEDWDNF